MDEDGGMDDDISVTYRTTTSTATFPVCDDIMSLTWCMIYHGNGEAE